MTVLVRYCHTFEPQVNRNRIVDLKTSPLFELKKIELEKYFFLFKIFNKVILGLTAQICRFSSLHVDKTLKWEQ